ncbi:MAG: hypothetical protein ACOYMA_14375 [Bacteroidia bacterium]
MKKYLLFCIIYKSEKPIEVHFIGFFIFKNSATYFGVARLYLCIKNKEMAININSKNLNSIGSITEKTKRKKSADINIKFDTIVELLEEIHSCISRIISSEITTENLYIYVKSIIESNKKFLLIQHVDKMNLDISDKIIVLELIWNKINRKETVNVLYMLSGILYTSEKCFLYMQNVLESKNQLIKQNLVEITLSDNINEIHMTLSETSLELFQKDGIMLFTDD